MLGKVRRPYSRGKLSLHEIAKTTGLSRNTIRKWVRDTGEVAKPTYRRREMPCKLTAFAEALDLALKADAHRTKPNRRTGKATNWRIYRSRFIDPVRIAAGVAFWQAHAATLERAEREFGVPAAIIVGIVGVETIYGRNVGNFRVMDALATLSFDFPDAHPRASERRVFFRNELEQLLSLAKRSGIEPLSLRGSYAGAMGLPQFMPSSWARYAIDFDGDGRVDLFRSPADVIGSVANYFKAFGWQPGMATHYPVQFDSTRLDLEALLAPDILPTFSAKSLADKGVLLDAAGQHHAGPLALVELQNGSAPAAYIAGTENFYAITRYNWSSYYAMAVIELGQAVAREMKNKP